MKSYMKFTELICKNKTKILFLCLLLLMSAFPVNKGQNAAFANGLRQMFINNSVYIYSINIRTFGAKDYNNNDIIEKDLGEVSGTFINAIPKLKELKSIGINTIYLLPITKVGKLHAKGTAGSLYAIDSFDTLNPQLLDETEIEPDINKQAKKFIEEAHKLNMNVILDLPGCGSYDLSIEKPFLFTKDFEVEYPSDWKDVRIFNPYESDGKTLNKRLLDEHKKFINLALSLGADGIRVDSAAIKPFAFWKELIDWTREKDSDFFFLAEASPLWENPIGKKFKNNYLSIEELLKAGFDGFYEDWSDLTSIKTNDDFYKKIKNDLKIIEKFNGQKSIIGTFATHDQRSPALIGDYYWQMTNWLNVTLPLNPYVFDGYPSKDTYDYKYLGMKPEITYTDNSDSYDVKRGVVDLFNFSRAPEFVDSKNYSPDFNEAIQFWYMMHPIIASKEIEFLKTNDIQVFAFRRKLNTDSIVVIGNLDTSGVHKAKVSVPRLLKNDFVLPFRMNEAPVAKNGSLNVELAPYEIQVFAIKKSLNKT